MNYTNRPIAAYTMAEFESLTSDNADFARGRGKDKKKRKSRAGLYAGIGAGAVGLGGLGAAGMRYGGAEIGKKTADSRLSKDMYRSQSAKLKDDILSRSGGAKEVFDRDVQSLKDMGSKIKNYDYKGAPGRAFDGIKGAAGKAGKFASLRGQQAAALATSAPGLAVLGAGLTAGAGYGIYKAMKKGKKK
jgi:hypothetical protein